MTASVIDTLAYAIRLKAAGFSTAQAEALADGLAEAIGGACFRKRDFDETMAASRRSLAKGAEESRAKMEQGRRESRDAFLRLDASMKVLQWMIAVLLALTMVLFVKVYV